MPILKAESLKEALAKHPDLPLVFFCDSEIWSNWEHEMWPATSITARVGKVLSPPDGNICDTTFTDEDEYEFEGCIRDRLDMLDETQGMNDDEFDALVEKEIEKYKPYWKDCIIVYLGA